MDKDKGDVIFDLREQFLIKPTSKKKSPRGSIMPSLRKPEMQMMIKQRVYHLLLHVPLQVVSSILS